MKLLHIPFTFYPDPVGGTEVYVEALAREQKKLGIEVIVAAPAENSAAYRHNGFGVRRFPVSRSTKDLRELYGEGDPCAAEAFAQILDEERPDVVHLHARTRGVSIRLVRESKRRGIPVVFSYHTPTVSCQRGTLLRWGSAVCDGALDLHACARCTLHAHRLPKAASVAIGSLPSGVGRLLDTIGASGRLWTALRMTELVEVQCASFRALMEEVDHVVALCQWAKDLLLRNGLPAEKVTVSRQGICQDPVEVSHATRPRIPGSGLRVAFLGRLDPTKGVHVLIEALRKIPETAIRLDVYGVAQGAGGASHRERLAKLARGDARVVFCAPVANDEVVARLREYDVLAVPSQWLETGPLVVMEAFAAGIPVVASHGIAELVQHGVNGLLVEYASRAAWAEALRTLSEDPELMNRLRSGIRPPRTMREAAAELMAVYRQVSQEAIAV